MSHKIIIFKNANIVEINESQCLITQKDSHNKVRKLIYYDIDNENRSELIMPEIFGQFPFDQSGDCATKAFCNKEYAHLLQEEDDTPNPEDLYNNINSYPELKNFFGEDREYSLLTMYTNDDSQYSLEVWCEQIYIIRLEKEITSYYITENYGYDYTYVLYSNDSYIVTDISFGDVIIMKHILDN